MYTGWYIGRHIGRYTPWVYHPREATPLPHPGYTTLGRLHPYHTLVYTTLGRLHPTTPWYTHLREATPLPHPGIYTLGRLYLLPHPWVYPLYTTLRYHLGIPYCIYLSGTTLGIPPCVYASQVPPWVYLRVCEGDHEAHSALRVCERDLRRIVLSPLCTPVSLLG